MPKFDYQQSRVFFRDSFMPFSEAHLSIASSPVLYGLSVYTVLSASWDEKSQKLLVFRLKDHYTRLVNSARIMDFHSFQKDWPYERFVEVITELLKSNEIQEDVLVRATVFIDELIAGTRIHDLKNSFSVYAYPTGQILPREGIHACVSSWQRTPDNAIPSRAKINGSYANASLMKNEALLNGYDEAIAVDERGHVAEGTVANLFIVRDSVLITPDAATDILEGITRDTVLTIAKNLNIPTLERSIDRSELYMTDEIFMCGSSAGVLPVVSVDKRTITTQAGPITQRIMDGYRELRQGNNSTLSEWIIKV
jgi:branched-chain amino acid aminotransferase